MKLFITLLILILMNNDNTLYDFSKKQSENDWNIEDDEVMGGKSQGHLESTSEHLKFWGHVSLENDGGFSSMQADMNTKDVSKYSMITIEVKGDGKTYNFRVKDDANQKHAYTREFKTNGEWQTIELPFNEFSPTFRGNNLDIPNYSGKTLGHVRILIGNKKEESFKLLVRSIGIK